jgi:carboxyl-terminal processing protease
MPTSWRPTARTTRDPDVVVGLSLGDLGYLRLASFDSERPASASPPSSSAAAARGARPGARPARQRGGLVLGGLQVLDLFLSEVVLGYRETRFGQIPLGFANPRAVALPLAVLVDRDTASTAEIVAGALQTKGRARLYGEVTRARASASPRCRCRTAASCAWSPSPGRCPTAAASTAGA